MAEFIIVGSSGAFQLESAANYSRKVTHEGGQTVYYSTSTRVGPTINDGTLTTGQTFTFTGRRFFITQSGTGTQGSSASLRLDDVPTPGEDVGTVAVSVRDFGAVGDGVTNDLPAFNAALAAIAASVDNTTNVQGTLSGRAGKLLIPRGQYFLNGTWHINRIVTIEGEGGAGWFPASQLIFPDSTPGIILDYYANSTDGGRADWSIIRGIGWVARGRSSSTAHGFQASVPFKLEDFSAWKFGGNGVHVDTASPVGVGNNFRIEYGTVYYCRNGLFIQGNDANAGLITQVDASYSDRWGFFDNSFLGNRYVGCHASSNALSLGGGTGGPYSMGYTTADVGNNLSASLLVGCYAESGQGAARLDQYVMALNCVFGDGLTTGSGGLNVTTDNIGAKFTRSVRVINTGASRKNTTAELGSQGGAVDRALSVYTDDASSDYNLDYDSLAAGWWAWNRGGSGTKIAWATSGGSASVGDGQFAVPNGLYIGGTTGSKVKAFLSATTTWDPASIADGAMTSTTLGVTSAAVGDTVTVGFSNAVPAGAILSGAVTSAGTVSVTLFNKTGGALDLASGTLRADVWQH